MSLGPLVHAAKQPRTDANLEGLSSEGRRRTKIMRTIAPIFLLCKPNLTNSQARSKVGIMRLNLDYKMPVIFGVLAVLTEDQVEGLLLLLLWWLALFTLQALRPSIF